MTENAETLMLSVETATRAGSIALSRGSRILAPREGDPAISHSNDLLRLIRTVLDEEHLSMREIDVFAVSLGPGSFTGLRIGLATVKSFAATLKRPCVGVPTLEAIASNAAGPTGQTLALLPAGRGEVFAQLFQVDLERRVTPLDEPTHLPPQRLLDQITDAPFSLTLTGEGAAQHSALIRERALASGIVYIENQSNASAGESFERRSWLLAPGRGVLAEAVAAQALARLSARGDFSPEAMRAIYVRPSDAELNKGL